VSAGSGGMLESISLSIAPSQKQGVMAKNMGCHGAADGSGKPQVAGTCMRQHCSKRWPSVSLPRTRIAGWAEVVSVVVVGALTRRPKKNKLLGMRSVRGHKTTSELVCGW
jgi:hypothetical protein